jgi:hypothetical protein
MIKFHIHGVVLTSRNVVEFRYVLVSSLELHFVRNGKSLEERNSPSELPSSANRHHIFSNRYRCLILRIE